MQRAERELPKLPFRNALVAVSAANLLELMGMYFPLVDLQRWSLPNVAARVRHIRISPGNSALHKSVRPFYRTLPNRSTNERESLDSSPHLLLGFRSILALFRPPGSNAAREQMSLSA